MSKINRRDCLKNMAIGLGALAGTKLEVFAQRSRGRSQPRRQRNEGQIEKIDPLTEYFQRWPGTETRPPVNPPILVTFHGLLDFFYNSSGPNDGTCGVGFHRGGGHHDPKVQLFEIGNSTPLESIMVNPNSEVKLGIVNAAGQDRPARVEFLKNNDVDDFRWVIDLQSRPWYQGIQAKPAPGYAAKLFVRHGTFFTHKRTKYLLNQVAKIELGPVSSVKTAELGHTGEHIGAAIVLAATEKVLLKFNGIERLLPQDPLKRYEVRFTNMCGDNTSHGPCDFDWRHFQEIRRNDFHHHREALDLKNYHVKYTVVLAPGQLITQTRKPRRGRHKMFNTDAAPCMGAGYGGGNGPS